MCQSRWQVAAVLLLTRFVARFRNNRAGSMHAPIIHEGLAGAFVDRKEGLRVRNGLRPPPSAAPLLTNSRTSVPDVYSPASAPELSLHTQFVCPRLHGALAEKGAKLQPS